MKTIHKYPMLMLVLNQGRIHLPVGAQVLSVQMQNNDLVMWALVDPKAQTEMRSFRIFGTGHPVENSDDLTYIASVQDGCYVWHIFEEKA